MQQNPIYKDLVLIGGGHSHALLLRMWAMNPVAGVRLTLISNSVLSPYSGMLPGLIAGHYLFEDNHIDMVKLCRFAQARFIQAEVTGLDTEHKRVQLQGRPAIQYDLLSINIGATPDLSVPGAREHTTPVKPIATFYQHWKKLLEQTRQDGPPLSIGVVGAGAGGVEILLAMDHALKRDGQRQREVQFHQIARDRDILSGYPKSVKNAVKQRFRQRGVKLHTGFDVERIEAGEIMAKDGNRLALDLIFWCTSAQAAAWPRQAGLSCDERGFIRVNGFLQSIDQADIFAAGDIAHLENNPRPKAGVYAVRQAPILHENLRRKLLRLPMKEYKPQEDFLSLLALGDQTATGTRRPLSFTGPWVWRWKDRIDRDFMHKFQNLPAMPKRTSTTYVPKPVAGEYDTTSQQMRCGGCGAKVGAQVLERVIAQLQPVQQQGVAQSIGDDAAVFTPPAGQQLVQSVDGFRSMIEDPYVFGQIAATHALSDLFAMHAIPHSAQAMASLPYGAETVVERDLYQMMAGAVDVLNQHGCALIGGHSAEAQEMTLGFVVNGTANSEQLLHKRSISRDQLLILTKPLGTGIIMAADMQHRASGRWVEQTLNTMCQSNQTAAELLYQHQASACTDITGFGLLGHLLEMLKDSEFTAQVELNKLPFLAGVHHCIENGISSTLQAQNLRTQRALFNDREKNIHHNYPLLFDPQTSGGLLASLPAEQAEACLQALHAAGYDKAQIIGKITTTPAGEFNERVWLV